MVSGVRSFTILVEILESSWGVWHQRHSSSLLATLKDVSPNNSVFTRCNRATKAQYQVYNMQFCPVLWAGQSVFFVFSDLFEFRAPQQSCSSWVCWHTGTITAEKKRWKDDEYTCTFQPSHAFFVCIIPVCFELAPSSGIYKKIWRSECLLQFE